MSLPKITVVTPSYNQGQFLEETILSVFNQDYPNLEYIIIDGGSTDDSVDIIQKYSDKLAYWVSESDRGQSDALNKGFKRATGDIIGWLNSDDIYIENSLYIMARSFAKYPEMDLIYGNHINIDDNSNVIKVCHDLPYIPWIWKMGGLFFCQPAGFFRRDVFRAIGYLNTDLHYSMDKDFFYRMLKYGCKFKHINEFIVKFRYHASSKGITSKKEVKKAVYELWAIYYGFTNTFIDKYIYKLCLFSFRALRFLNNFLKTYFRNL